MWMVLCSIPKGWLRNNSMCVSAGSTTSTIEKASFRVKPKRGFPSCATWFTPWNRKSKTRSGCPTWIRTIDLTVFNVAHSCLFVRLPAHSEAYYNQWNQYLFRNTEQLWVKNMVLFCAGFSKVCGNCAVIKTGHFLCKICAVIRGKNRQAQQTISKFGNWIQFFDFQSLF